MDINFDLVEYVSGLVPLRKSGRYFIGACPICGGRDRFTIKREKLDLWICRKCTTDGKYHDAIDFVQQYHGVDFKEAVQRMGEKLPERLPLGEPHRYTPAPVQVSPSHEWQAQAWKRIDAASNLLTSDESGIAWRYLSDRGISRGAIYMNLLGYATVYNRPAILIPWLDAGDVVTAIKYRFIDELAQMDKGKRYTMQKGSMPYLFGLQHVLNSDSTLLFVEGELNAISILQTLPRGVSMVSAGSEGNGHEALLRALASRYQRVMIWTDDPNKGADLRARMDRTDARIIKSPYLEGRKWDANEMLQAGVLFDFLTRKLSAECMGIPAQLPMKSERTA